MSVCFCLVIYVANGLNNYQSVYAMLVLCRDTGKAQWNVTEKHFNTTCGGCSQFFFSALQNGEMSAIICKITLSLILLVLGWP